MVANEGKVQGQCEPFTRRKKQDVEEKVKEVFRQDLEAEVMVVENDYFGYQWVEASALVYRILVVSFQFIKCYYLGRKGNF